MTEQTPPTRSRPRIPMALIAVVVGVGLATVAIYGMRGLQGNASGDPVCRPAVNLAQKLKPLAQGEVAALTMASQPLRVPDLTFDDTSGKTRKLSEFRGRTLLVLWNPDRPEAGPLEIMLDPAEPRLVCVAAGVWHGFRACGDEPSVLLHMNDRAFDWPMIDEVRLPQDDPSIPYRWDGEGAR